MSSDRPSPWLLAPAAVALLLLAVSFRDFLVAPASFLLLVAAYGHRRSLSPPRVGGGILLAIVAAIASGSYYLVLLSTAADRNPVPRVVPGSNLLIAVSGLTTAMALVWLWHLRHPATGKTGAALTLCCWIAVASGDQLGLGRGYLACLALFLVALITATALTVGGGLGARAAVPRLALLALLAALIGAGTWAAGRSLRLTEHALLGIRIDRLGLGLPTYTGLGSGHGMLVQRHSRLRPSLSLVATLDGDDPPGYLRTQVLSEYSEGHWRAGSLPSRIIEPVTDQENNLPTFAMVRAPHTEETHRREVLLMADLRGAVPLAYGTTHLSTSDPVTCVVDIASILRCSPSADLSAYQMTVGSRDWPGPPTSSDTDIPDELRQPLTPLARDIVGDAADAMTAVRRLESYLQTSHRYSLVVHLAAEGDPILDFVVNRRPGYCEHFASALTMLARSIGIPARVVGGFSVEEHNHLAGAWVVRQRDAHAWTEVYDATTATWVRLDATPPAVTALRQPSGFAAWRRQLADWLRFTVRRVSDWWRAARPGERLADLAVAAWTAAIGHPAVSTSVLLVGAALTLLSRRRLAAWVRSVRLRRGRSAEGISRATRAFARVAHALEGAGRPIGRSETVADYLARTPDDELLTRFLTTYRCLRFASGSGESELATLDDLSRVTIRQLHQPVPRATT